MTYLEAKEQPCGSWFSPTILKVSVIKFKLTRQMPHLLSHLTGLAFLISEEVPLPTDLTILNKEKKKMNGRGGSCLSSSTWVVEGN